MQMDKLSFLLTPEETGDLTDIRGGSKGKTREHVYNLIAAGTFPIPTYLDGRRYCDYCELADYLDECHAGAKLANE